MFTLIMDHHTPHVDYSHHNSVNEYPPTFSINLHDSPSKYKIVHNFLTLIFNNIIATLKNKKIEINKEMCLLFIKRKLLCVLNIFIKKKILNNLTSSDT